MRKIWSDEAWEDYLTIVSGELLIVSCRGHYEK